MDENLRDKAESKLIAGLCSWRQKIQQHPVRSAAIIVTCALIVAIIGGYLFNWDWVGFDVSSIIWTVKATSGTTLPAITQVNEHLPAKTFWDWLQLAGIVAIPVVVGIGAAQFTTKQAQVSEEANRKQRELELEIARDDQRQKTLEAYLDRMSELLLTHGLRKSKSGDEVRYVVRVRTLAALRSLDPARKGSLLQFLHESGLIHRDEDDGIIDLKGADLSKVDLSIANLSSDPTQGTIKLSRTWMKRHGLGVNLQKAKLNGVNLKEAKLSGVKLSEADLCRAYLSAADLKKAELDGAWLQEARLRKTILQEADLSKADLSDAYLHRADLSKAILSNANLNGANLSNANLSGADLTDADLTGAVLRGANLTGAVVTQKQLAQAISLKGATMLDGSKHP